MSAELDDLFGRPIYALLPLLDHGDDMGLAVHFDTAHAEYPEHDDEHEQIALALDYATSVLRPPQFTWRGLAVLNEVGRVLMRICIVRHPDDNDETSVVAHLESEADYVLLRLVGLDLERLRGEVREVPRSLDSINLVGHDDQEASQ